MAKQTKKGRSGRPPELTWDRFKRICETLERTGVRYKSCQSHGWDYETVRTRMKAETEKGNPEWQALWDLSVELYRDHLEEEARRRAVEGWDEPVFYKGEEVGYLRKYDSSLLRDLLRAERPEKFRENIKLDADVRGGVLVVPPTMSVEDWVARYGQRAQDPLPETGGAEP